jgi:hypothetical protein
MPAIDMTLFRHSRAHWVDAVYLIYEARAGEDGDPEAVVKAVNLTRNTADEQQMMSGASFRPGRHCARREGHHDRTRRGRRARLAWVLSLITDDGVHHMFRIVDGRPLFPFDFFIPKIYR